ALVEMDLNNGESGDLRTSDETLSRNVNLFFKTVTHHRRKLVLDASLGLLATYFDRDDLLADTTQNRSLRRHFEPVLLPMISMRYLLTDKYAVYALVSRDRKSTRLNSSHVKISYAVFCLKKKKNTITSDLACQIF